jgi:hypothetical protein
MFTLEESALLGRMLRTLAVMGVCTGGGVGYVLLRASSPARPAAVSEPSQPANGPTHQAVHHHRLRSHLTHRTTDRSSALSI